MIMHNQVITSHRKQAGINQENRRSNRDQLRILY